MGAEGSRAAGEREPDHMAVVGLAESGFLQLRFPLLYKLIGDLPCSARLQQGSYEAARGIQPAQLPCQLSPTMRRPSRSWSQSKTGTKSGCGGLAKTVDARFASTITHTRQPPRNRRSSSRKKLRYPGGALTMFPCSSSSRRWIWASPLRRSK